MTLVVNTLFQITYRSMSATQHWVKASHSAKTKVPSIKSFKPVLHSCNWWCSLNIFLLLQITFKIEEKSLHWCVPDQETFLLNLRHNIYLFWSHIAMFYLYFLPTIYIVGKYSILFGTRLFSVYFFNGDICLFRWVRVGLGGNHVWTNFYNFVLIVFLQTLTDLLVDKCENP